MAICMDLYGQLIAFAMDALVLVHAVMAGRAAEGDDIGMSCKL